MEDINRVIKDALNTATWAIFLHMILPTLIILGIGLIIVEIARALIRSRAIFLIVKVLVFSACLFVVGIAIMLGIEKIPSML